MIDLMTAMDEMTARERVAVWRGLLEGNLHTFLRTMVGFHDPIRKVDLLDGSHGRWLCGAVQDVLECWLNNQERIVAQFLIARGHIKTSVGTTGAPIWLEIQARKRLGASLRQAIYTDGQRRMYDFFGGLRGRMERAAEEINTLWPEIFWLRPDSDSKAAGAPWNMHEMMLRQTGDWAHKEYNFQVYSIMAAGAGPHHEAHWYDDIVNQENTYTSERMALMAAVKEKYKLSLSVLQPRGLAMHFGTIYHFGDLMAELREQLKDVVVFDVVRKISVPVQYTRPDVIEDAEGREVVTFPEAFTRGDLKKIEEDQGDYIYQCQYRLRPLDPSKLVLNPDHYVMVEREQLPPGLVFDGQVDPAVGTKKDSDYSVCWIRGVDHQGNWWLVDGFRIHEGGSERLCRRILDLALKWGAGVVGFEAIAFQRWGIQAMRHVQEAYADVLYEKRDPKHEAYLRGLWGVDAITADMAKQVKGGWRMSPLQVALAPFNPKGTGSHQASKDDRIRVLDTLLSQRRIHVLRSIPFVDQDGRAGDMTTLLMAETGMFPFGGKKDILDALSAFHWRAAQGVEPETPETEMERFRARKVREAKRGRGR